MKYKILTNLTTSSKIDRSTTTSTGSSSHGVDTVAVDEVGSETTANGAENTLIPSQPSFTHAIHYVLQTAAIDNKFICIKQQNKCNVENKFYFLDCYNNTVKDSKW